LEVAQSPDARFGVEAIARIDGDRLLLCSGCVVIDGRFLKSDR
jgi:hypothetical protein